MPPSALALLTGPSGAAGGGTKVDVSPKIASGAESALNSSGSTYDTGHNKTGDFSVGGGFSTKTLLIVAALGAAFLVLRRYLK